MASGEEVRRFSSQNDASRHRPAGAQNAALQPKWPTSHAAQIAITAPPIWCDAFHIPQARPISLGLNQLVSRRTQGGTPVPWKALFSAQSTANDVKPAAKPNAILTIAERRSPRLSRSRGLARSPMMPLNNFENASTIVA